MARPRKEIPDHVLEAARQMRAGARAERWPTIGEALGYSHELIRKRIDPVFAASKRLAKRDTKAPSKFAGFFSHPDPGQIVVPREVVVERAVRQAAKNRMTTMALLLGDPPPGFSALDRR